MASSKDQTERRTGSIRGPMLSIKCTKRWLQDFATSKTSGVCQKRKERNNDRSQDRNTRRVACRPAGVAQGREGADAAQRRAGAAASGAAVGSDRQGISI